MLIINASKYEGCDVFGLIFHKINFVSTHGFPFLAAPSC